jgi:hypothetical protein
MLLLFFLQMTIILGYKYYLTPPQWSQIKYILDHPKEFHNKTHHRAEFYIKVIKKKKGLDIIHHHHYHYH